MIFQYTWPQVVLRHKTATRRVISPTEVAIRTRYNKVSTVKQNGRTKWQVGATYAVQPGRGQSQIARIRLTRITRQQLSRITNAQARAEGFADRQAFLKTWQTIHGPDRIDRTVWVIEFELVEVKPTVKKLTWPESVPQPALSLMPGAD
jgi:hypothetical protein